MLPSVKTQIEQVRPVRPSIQKQRCSTQEEGRAIRWPDTFPVRTVTSSKHCAITTLTRPTADLRCESAGTKVNEAQYWWLLADRSAILSQSLSKLGVL